MLLGAAWKKKKSLSGVETTRRHCFQFVDPKLLSSESGFLLLRQYLSPSDALGVSNAVDCLTEMFGD